MTKISVPVIGVLLVALMPAAPAAAQSREQRQMMATLQILQEQAQQLAITMAALQQALDESVKALNARIDESNNATRRSFADQKLAVDNVANDVRVIRQSADDTNVRIASLREELEAVRSGMLAIAQPAAPGPVVPFDPNAPPTSAPGPAAGAPSPVAPPLAPPPSTVGLSPTRMYETARADYFAGQYSVAITGFEQFLKAFPRSELADDAQFNIGEAYYTQNKWDDAITAYNQVVQTYPQSNSVPDALYKRGLAQERLGQTDAARASWDAAVKGYPDSDAGRLARQSLDRLGARRP
jgi:tol-pal system protein YbgF